MINNITSYCRSNINRPIAFKRDTKKEPIEITGSKTKAKVYTAQPLDYKTYEQIKVLCNHPSFTDLPIRIMPDVHPSQNTLVGFSAPVNNEKIIPGIIGGDIGCGMLCVKLDTQGQDIDYEKLDDVIRTYVSVDRTKTPHEMRKLPKYLSKDIDNVCRKFDNTTAAFQESRLGTLGGGNHFIEIDKDKNGNAYLIIHSGSRNFGKQVAEYHDHIARKQNHYYIKNLSWLNGDEANEYMSDMRIAQNYAKANRRMIADEILFRMGWKEKTSFESIHNYISEDGMIRKGAISSKKGEDILIPLNMRDGVILAKGKGNKDWNETAPHGAGRKMARGLASQELSYKNFKNSMQGIYTTCVRPETLDEAPDAYKPAIDIIENINDTADIQEVIKPIFNYKD